jgi:cholesterol transport system auxiliary component
MSKLVIDRRHLLVLGASAAALSACSGIVGPPAAAPLYVLNPGVWPSSGGARTAWQLSIALPEAPQSLDTDRIALLQPSNQMDFYANAAWQDRLPFLVQSALIEAFENDGRVNGVGRDTDGLRSDYLLETDIRDFQAHYDVMDGIPTAEVRIAARMIATHGRTIARALSAQAKVPATENKVPAVVTALNQALGKALDQIVNWAAAAPMPAKE